MWDTQADFITKLQVVANLDCVFGSDSADSRALKRRYLPHIQRPNNVFLDALET